MKEMVPLLVGIPLSTAFLIAILSHMKATSRLAGLFAPLAIAANLALSIWICIESQSGGNAIIWAGQWNGLGKPIGIELVCDGLARLMVITINMVALAVVIYSVSYMKHFTAAWLFNSLFLLMVGAMNGVVLSGDLFNMYVFFEMAAIASYALVAFGTESEDLEAAFRYMILGVIASVFILMGITILYSLTGQLNMARVSEIISARNLLHGPAVILAAACLMGGMALKSAMVPFHSWLPDAHPSAPAPVSAMLSAVLIKAIGIYTLSRIVFGVFGANEYYANVMLALGTVSMVVGGFLALGQWDLKRLLAYSSISQMGYIVLAVGASAAVVARGGDMSIASLCLFGAFFHMFNHATFKSLLFLTSGSIEQATGTRDLRELGGLSKRMPVTSFCCRIGTLSIAGIPPFNAFFSKLIIIIALVLAGYPILAASAVLVAVLTLLYVVKIQRYALEGDVSPQTQSSRESPWPMGVGMIALAVLCLLAGLAILPLKQYLFDPANKALLESAASAGRLVLGGAQ